MKSLYIITDGGELRESNQLIPKLKSALEVANGAVSYIQLREQISDDEPLLSLAAELKDLCSQFGAKLIVNRRSDLLANFDGVHLGSPPVSIKAAREQIAPGKLIGYSAHSLAEAVQADSLGADYIFLSPIFRPISKEHSGGLIGLERLREAYEQIGDKLIPLGGITAQNASDCYETGVKTVAMIGGVLLADDVAEAVRGVLGC